MFFTGNFFFQLVNTILRAFPHVLVLGCSGQQQNLGPLLAALKVKQAKK